MATTFISSNSISTTLRSSAMKSQVALSKATTEATNGRYADVGLTLGALTGRDVVLRAELVDVDKLVDTNVLVVVMLIVVAISGSFIGAHIYAFTELLYSRIEHGF